jgi:hypothetical protein
LGDLDSRLLVVEVSPLGYIRKKKVILHQKGEQFEGVPSDAEPSENARDQFSPFLLVITSIAFPDVVKKTYQEKPVRMVQLLKNLPEKGPAVIILPLGNVCVIDRSQKCGSTVLHGSG